MLQRMCWIFPDRESSRTAAQWNRAFWRTYQEVAEELGMSWERTAPEAVTVDALDPQRPRVYVDGVPVTPQDTLFVTSPYTLPYQAADAFNQFTLYAVLEQAGFYLPHPTWLAALGNDKLATLLFLKDSPVPPVPTVRIGSGRDLLYDEFLPAVRNLPYPAIAKPAGWAASRGINMAHDDHDVRGLLSLAQGGDTTLVFQPYLGRATTDYRIHMVDGRPHTTLVRIPGDGARYPQYSTGARLHYAPLPDELAAAADYFAKKLPMPYFCVDFLHDGERFWLSEVEPDGAIMCPDPGDAEVVRQNRAIVRDRFLAYRDGHARLQGEDL
ncbi:RimK family alpha-L-glutamate ligase [Actinoplanes sp. NPDC049681]|uniref:RimK family alpha-L-glutamate ligase n=1 Tax=Actinoplanes sp. NPDC049681 TaxID=3363905 RepID=UPI0037BBB11F